MGLFRFLLIYFCFMHAPLKLAVILTSAYALFVWDSDLPARIPEALPARSNAAILCNSAILLKVPILTGATIRL
jgi:hypothetical protein